MGEDFKGIERPPSFSREKSDTLDRPRLDIAEVREGIKKRHSHRFASVIGKVLIVLFVLLGVTGGVFAYKIASVSRDIFKKDGEVESVVSQAFRLLFAGDRTIASHDGRTNILLLGIGGENHDGALLTDTIMVASIDHARKQVALISIPRDLYVTIPGYGKAKINSAYARGEQRSGGSGAELAGKVVSDVIGVPIDYYVRVDFEGFKQSVDTLDGIDVDVAHSFYDSQYPTENYGYQRISFEKGLQHFDGDTALKYVRSRHGVVTDRSGTSEGSDFARSKRQQDVLLAMYQKALSVGTIVNPVKINSLLSIMGSHVRTSFEPWEILFLIDFGKKVDTSKLINQVIDDGESGLLVSSRSSAGAYILLPQGGTYEAIHALVKNIFVAGDIKNEQAAIVVLNGTETAGLAKKAQTELAALGMTVTDTGNFSADPPLQNVLIVPREPDRAPATVALLMKHFGTQAEVGSRDRISSIDPALFEANDIVIILGSSYKGTN